MVFRLLSTLQANTVTATEFALIEALGGSIQQDGDRLQVVFRSRQDPVLELSGWADRNRFARDLRRTYPGDVRPDWAHRLLVAIECSDARRDRQSRISLWECGVTIRGVLQAHLVRGGLMEADQEVLYLEDGYGAVSRIVADQVRRLPQAMAERLLDSAAPAQTVGSPAEETREYAG